MIAIVEDGRIIELVFLVLFISVTYYIINLTSKKKFLPKIRRLPALDAIDEAAGRCAEMGSIFMADIGFAKKMSDMDFMQSLAGISVIRYAADKCAQKDIAMVIGTAAPDALQMVREVVREAYMVHGAPERFEENVFRYTASFGMGYPIQMVGLLLEFRPASFLTVGMMAASTVIYSEAARRLGALTIGGTGTVSNLAFIVGCYDYILMGEEIFAAGAYVSEDPVQIGSITAIDVSKLALMTISLLGIILISAGNDIVKVILGM